MGAAYLICQLVGVFYPAYASFKAIEATEGDDEKQWLTYWVVHALLLLAESWVGWLFMWFPLYDVFKLLFILWLIAPQTQGAKKIYGGVFKPFLVRHAGTFEPMYAGTQKVIELNLTNKVAKMVETHGPGAAEKMVSAMYNMGAGNLNKLVKLAEKDPHMFEQALKMVVDTVGQGQNGARVGR